MCIGIPTISWATLEWYDLAWPSDLTGQSGRFLFGTTCFTAVSITELHFKHRCQTTETAQPGQTRPIFGSQKIMLLASPWAQLDGKKRKNRKIVDDCRKQPFDGFLHDLAAHIWHMQLSFYVTCLSTSISGSCIYARAMHAVVEENLRLTSVGNPMGKVAPCTFFYLNYSTKKADDLDDLPRGYARKCIAFIDGRK